MRSIASEEHAREPASPCDAASRARWPAVSASDCLLPTATASVGEIFRVHGEFVGGVVSGRGSALVGGLARGDWRREALGME